MSRNLPREPTAFDPEQHQSVAEVGFEGLKVGQIFRLPSRTVTEAQFAAFQVLSGDNHPIHYDREYCRRHGHNDLLAHGLQVLAATAAGAGPLPALMGGSLVGFLEQSCRFLAPVLAGDTLYPTLRIGELIRQTTTGVVVVESEIKNHRGEAVLLGEQRYLLRLERG